jgi:hypothetical protein
MSIVNAGEELCFDLFHVWNATSYYCKYYFQVVITYVAV